jgi:pyruvate dehydrogenase E2 component (dihydrolipoamide acetyltransferase)
MRLRAQLKDSGIPLSVNDLILKAVTLGAQKHPRVQGQLQGDDKVLIPDGVHLGVAVALEDGLITPVVRNAQALSIGEMSRQVRELAGKARDRKLKPNEYQGGTITVSNLGMFDIEHFYAIVNPPQASIVSVVAVREEAVVEKGQIVVGHRMRIGYSGDHRIVDGAVGAKFLQEVKKALENPMEMVIG